MNPEDLPKGPSGELASLDGRKPMNKPGVYRHEAAGKEIIVMPDPTSTAQQDALVRMGYMWVADPPTRAQLLDMQAKQLAQDVADLAAGKMQDPYSVPGEQAVVFNGSATDIGGQGDHDKAMAEENRLLREKLAAFENPDPAPPTDAEPDEAPEPSTEPTNKKGK